MPRVPPPTTRNRCARCGMRHQSVCSAVPEADLTRLAAVAIEQTLEKGQSLAAEGEPATEFFNVRSGTVKLFKLLPDGRQQIIGFATAGHFLGLAASATYEFSAEAIETVQVCRFSRPRLHELLRDFPALEARLLQTACGELIRAQDQVLLLGRKTAQERVASFLLEWAERSGNAAAPLLLPMSRTEIADYLGLTVETVSRTLSRFKADRRIALPSTKEVVLLDPAWLEAVASGTAPALHPA